MNNKLYIITGAAGNLGLNLTKSLVAKKQAVRALVLPHEVDLIKTIPEVEYTVGDITKPATLEPLFLYTNHRDIIFIHCASLISIASKSNQALEAINVQGTKNILNLVVKNKVKRFIYISSVHAFPELKKGEITYEIKQFDETKVIGGYARTKALATKQVMAAIDNHGLDGIIIFPSGIIGPGQNMNSNMLNMFLNYLRGTTKISVNGGFDFVDIRDVTAAIIKASEVAKKGDHFILSNQYYSFKEVMTTIADVATLKPIRVFLPKTIAYALATIFEIYYRISRRVPVLTKYAVYTAFQNSLYSHAHATKVLGFNPRPLKETLIDVVVDLKARKII